MFFFNFYICHTFSKWVIWVLFGRPTYPIWYTDKARLVGVHLRFQSHSTATLALHWMWPAASRHAITRTVMIAKEICRLSYEIIYKFLLLWRLHVTQPRLWNRHRHRHRYPCSDPDPASTPTPAPTSTLWSNCVCRRRPKRVKLQ